MLNQLQPILNFFASSIDASSTNRKEARSSQSMLKNQSTQQSHLQPVIHYFNEQGNKRATESKGSQRSEPVGWLRRFGQMLTVNTDPRIKQRFDRSGQMYWQVYDPVSEQHFAFSSEDEVYRWLESRYLLN